MGRAAGGGCLPWRARSARLAAAACACWLAVCGPGSRSAGQATAPAAVPALREALADDFPVGAAVWRGDLNGPHSELLKKHFSSIVAENDMKMERLQPVEGVFRFDAADALVAFARANTMRVRGHTLVWHNQNPRWLFRDALDQELRPSPESKALMLKRLESHIRAVAGHFKDDVYAWDVVNEVIDPAQPDGFRRSRWFELTGSDYIDAAFRMARLAAPKARLFINDYDTTEPKKRQLLLNLVRDMKARGVPVDGIGHQMHIRIAGPPVDEIKQTIEMFLPLGVENQITEMDMSVYDSRTGSCAAIPQEVLIEQGYRYREIFGLLRAMRGKVTAVTFWGVADDHTWLKSFPIRRLDLPLLFDERSEPKPAFWAVVDPAGFPGRFPKVEIPPSFRECSAPRSNSP